MKMKKVTALLLAGLMTFSLTACVNSGDSGSNDAQSSGSSSSDAGTESTGTESTGTEADSTGTAEGVTNLVLWTWNDDALTFAKKFNETHDNIQVEAINVAASGEYETKVQTAILGGEKEPDIIGAEPGWITMFMEAGFFANLDDFGAKDYEGVQVDYVWQEGQDEDGVQRAISYQITPAGFYYRRDVADAVFGYSDPESVAKLFTSYESIMEAARDAKAKGYRLFASDSELAYCTYNEPWVVDGVLNLNDERLDRMEMTSAFYNEGLTAYAAQWTTPWYQSMAGEVPVLTEEVQWGTDDLNVWGGDTEEAAEDFMEQAAALGFNETTECMAFGLPSWGNLILQNHAGDTFGNWGFVAGPTAGWGGGSYFGISENSEKKDAAWQYLKWMTHEEDTLEWWYQEGGDQGTGGDAVSIVSLLEKHSGDTNEAYGGQTLYKEWMEVAKDIDFSVETKYDSDLNNKWGEAISNYKTGQMTKDEAVNYFYDQVESTYAGEITVNR